MHVKIPTFGEVTRVTGSFIKSYNETKIEICGHGAKQPDILKALSPISILVSSYHLSECLLFV